MYKKRFALLLALLMALTAALALAEAPAQPEDPVLATVNGKELTKSQVDAEIVQFLDNNYIENEADYNTVLEYLVNRELVNKKVAELGFDQFTKEEDDAFLSEAQQQFDTALASYADYYQSADSEKAREEAEEQARNMFADRGLTVELVAEDLKHRASLDRLYQYLLGGYEPSEEEIQQLFQEVGAMYQAQYENDIPQYEYATQYAGQNSWYTPPGFRGVVHILLNPDETLMNNYKALNAAFEEQQQKDSEVPLDNGEEGQQDPEAPETPITQQMLDEARKAVMDSRQADIDLIYQRLERGESFIDLIREYGEDPGMTVEANLKDGYPVHAQSILYDPAFTQAAFSEKMQQVGDVSDPALSSFGIHILHYLRDVPAGLELTDAIRTEIEDYLTSQKQNEVFAAALLSWAEQENVVYNQEAIEAAITAAQERIQANQEEPLTATPEGEGEGQNP